VGNRNLSTPPAEVSSSVQAILTYHSRTKHHLHGHAAAPGYLDWENQPEPFRTFDGTERVELPLLADRLDATYSDLYTSGAIAPTPLELNSVAMLFELALGLSAWKQYESNRWAVRTNPSSGNLHPTEGYAILAELPGLNAGVYHYLSRDHCLERRCVLEERGLARLTAALPPDCFLVGLSSIHWREAWKYGERAFRYCQHDVGHAIATVRYAAASLGWSARLIEDASDKTIADMLGLSQSESFADVAQWDREHPDALLLVTSVGPRETGKQSGGLDLETTRDVLHAGAWVGRANPLSPAHVEWPAIDAAADASWKEDRAARTERPAVPGSGEFAVLSNRPPDSSQIAAVRIIKQRRSCLALDGTTSISAEAFYSILDRLLPRPDVPPWDTWPWPPHLNCGIFVHRVRDLPSGLYVFERNPTVHHDLRSSLRADFQWERPHGCPEYLPLFRLVEGDFRQTAQGVSCQQGIAADGAFSLGMIADFGDSIRRTGAWWYRRLFWESGLIGQVLYLEAEAAGVRGTGIGCYFDDAFHDLLGVRGDRFQSLYHFTVGGPVDDLRLKTLAPYSHLEDRGQSASKR
jgi:SagB-type dehydrogenase family enzyme